ncbi:MAG: MarR family transcriptional regulator [Mailhella sp.]|nr:MarR family transcriptional regulator [Mailhella sp.]
MNQDTNTASPAPDEAPNIISMINGLVHCHIDNELEKAGAAGLVSSHGLILAALYRFGPMPMGRIAALIGRSKGTLTVLADKLEKLGYIERSASVKDCRGKVLRLTEKGMAFKKNFSLLSEGLNHRFWHGMSPAEQAEFMRLLAKIRTNMSARRKEPV